jgi:hypothetical protein
MFQEPNKQLNKKQNGNLVKPAEKLKPWWFKVFG